MTFEQIAYGPPQARPQLKRPGLLNELIRTAIFVLAATVLFDMAIPRSLVNGTSMEPTFLDGERLVVSRLHYLSNPPKRGEIVVFNAVRPNDSAMLIKRVIGLPGETISLRDGDVYIDGQRLREPYTNGPCTRMSCRQGVTVLGGDEYFIMGDNRNVSVDSRIFGPVPFDHIVGRVVLRFFPLDRVGIVDRIGFVGLDAETPKR
jgi:signal peptidase I